MKLLRVVGSLDPAEGGLSQAIRSSAPDLEKLGISTEVVTCDSPEVSWLGQDTFPVHALGPRQYGFAYTPKLGPWLDENLSRFDAVIIDGLWLWPSTCAVRAVARERSRRKEQKTGHGLTRMGEDKSERLAADRTKGEYLVPGTPALGGLSSEKSDAPESLNVQLPAAVSSKLRLSTLNSKQPRCFVMPHGMLDPWFQRDPSRRVKAVRNWFYWWLVERGVVNSADALLFTCQQELDLARTTFGGYRPKKEVVVGLGIEEPPVFEPKMQEAFEARCPDLNGRPYLLFMSRVHPKKGVDLLVRAYARVRSEHEEKTFSHGLTRIDEDGSERLAADRTRTECLVPGTPAVDGLSTAARTERDSLPDLVIAGPGWDSDYGKRIKELIREQGAGSREQVGVIHAVDMLQGDAKWGALYGCEAFVLPSHQENFGIAVVEALACGKPVLISDQVNIWREIAEDGAGLVEGDTEESVEKLLRQFLCGMRHEADDGVSHGLGKMDEDGSERLAADRTGGNADCRMTSTAGGLPPETADGGPRACYLKRFAIGPAVASLSRALQEK